jgi:Protein of Unknown function (DUF2784)
VVYRFLADVVLLAHLAFILFVVAGGFLALRWPGIAWIQLPAALWGVVVEWSGWICPLTPLENWLRARGGGTRYEGGFVAHYLLQVLYPAGLTRSTQVLLGATVLALNVLAYALLFVRATASRRS